MEPLVTLSIIFLSILLMILIFNYLYYNFYVDKTEAYPIATFTIVISMSISFICILIIPIDIYLISSKEISFSNISIDRANLKTIILILYSILLFCSFFLIPFAYFYGNTELDDLRSQNETRDKTLRSLRHSLNFILICLFLIILGMYFNKGSDHVKTDHNSWIHDFLDADHRGEKPLSFVISLLSLIGMVFLIIYTGYGLGALPLFLIKGKKSLTEAYHEFEINKSMIKDRIMSLQEIKKKRGNLNDAERKELGKLKESQANVENQITKLSNIINSEALFSRFLKFLTPIRVFVGIFLLMISLLIVTSLLITSLDKLVHSKCGISCGFTVESRMFINYFDAIFLFFSKHFHIDYILFTILNFYVYVCSLYGFVHFGVGIFHLNIFEVKKRNTHPQGLLIGAFIISVMILAFMVEILNMVPQYSTFGTQTFRSGSSNENIQCYLNENKSSNHVECVMSNISLIFGKISLNFPYYSSIFFLFNWCFIAVLSFSLIYNSFFNEEQTYPDIADSDFVERSGLLSNENNYL